MRKNLKFLLLPLFFQVAPALTAQQSLPVIKANSTKAVIVEGADDNYGWNISPGIKPDIHIAGKSVEPLLVRFYTDIDSIRVKIKAGEHFDFIVLLNEKDSCYTRIESWPVQTNARHLPASDYSIPFTLTEFNNIKIRAVLNKTDTLDLKFDSGTTGLLLTNDAIKNKTDLPADGGGHNSLQIGEMSWDSLPVYPVELSGQGTEGRFGWDLFDGKIVEINYDKNLFLVHSRLPEIDKTYSKFDIEYKHSLFCIRASLQVTGKKYPNRFLFDNGYQRTIMLDTAIMNEQNFPANLPVIKKVVMKNGQGKEIPVITVNNERLNLGKNFLLNIPAQLMTGSNPARFKKHILGNEILKRFNTILDFKNNAIYLQPNSLTDLPYMDAK